MLVVDRVAEDDDGHEGARDKEGRTQHDEGEHLVELVDVGGGSDHSAREGRADGRSDENPHALEVGGEPFTSTRDRLDDECRDDEPDGVDGTFLQLVESFRDEATHAAGDQCEDEECADARERHVGEDEDREEEDDGQGGLPLFLVELHGFHANWEDVGRCGADDGAEWGSDQEEGESSHHVVHGAGDVVGQAPQFAQVEPATYGEGAECGDRLDGEHSELEGVPSRSIPGDEGDGGQEKDDSKAVEEEAHMTRDEDQAEYCCTRLAGGEERGELESHKRHHHGEIDDDPEGLDDGSPFWDDGVACILPDEVCEDEEATDDQSDHGCFRTHKLSLVYPVFCSFHCSFHILFTSQLARPTDRVGRGRRGWTVWTHVSTDRLDTNV